MRVYAAGSIANISLFVVAFLITMSISSFVIPETFHEDGIQIERVLEGTPAYNILQTGMIIESLNGVNVTDGNAYSSALSTLKPDETVNVTTDRGNYSFKAGKNPNNNSLGYMGVQAVKNYQINDNVADTYGNTLPWIWFSLLELFNWIAFLNLAIGLFNLLPMKPLDGGHLLEELLDYKLSENIVKPIIVLISSFMIFIIAISLIAGLTGGLF